MKQKLKSNKGITLLALIITIIVLLILATVSVKLIVDNGIIGRAEGATSKYTVAEEKEKINLAYADYKMAKAENGTATLTVEGATVSGDETSGWIITFDKTGNRYKFDPSQGAPELKPKTEDEEFLEKYLLGEDKKGIDLSTILKDGKFTKDSVEFCGRNVTDNLKIVYAYVKYKNKEYKVILKFEFDTTTETESFTTQSVEYIYEPKGREGQTVKYSYDGKKENEKDWTVLYDYGDTVEIISPDVILEGNEYISLGMSDKKAEKPGDIDKDGEANTSLDKSIYSYNNAISRLNENSADLITNPNKISVRSVGSNPYNPSAESGMYKSEQLSQWLDGKYNGIGKGPDSNCEQDIVRMGFFGINSTGKSYWLASRNVFVNDISEKIEIGFWIKSVDESGGGDFGYALWGMHPDYVGTAGGGGSCTVRPVVKVNKTDVGL